MNYLEEIVTEELKKANEKHGGKFPSIEHTLTVLREEIEESQEEVENIKACFDKIWKDYRGQNVNDLDFKRLEMFATNLIEEAVQVIAMVRKYQNSKENMK
jgi:hypothetical protein